jgi:hypothetical protein
MTFGEWLALGGFLLSCVSTIVGVTWGIGKINKEVSEKVAEESAARSRAVLEAVEARNAELEKIRRDWTESQNTQDRNFGEVGLSLRRFIETVEKGMHEAELWGRDHYVQKPDFEKAIDKLSAEIKAGNADLKADFTAGIQSLKSEMSARG